MRSFSSFPISFSLLMCVLALAGCGNRNDHRDNAGLSPGSVAANSSVAVSSSLAPNSGISSGTVKSTAETLVTSSSHGQAKLVKTFKGPGDTVGIVVQMNNGQKQIVFASNDFKVLFLSALDEQGASLNQKALTEQNVYVSPTELAQNLVGKGFVVGKSGPIISVFMDPNCIFCNKFYKEINPMIAQGKVRVRFLMVGFLKSDSIQKSVAILASKDTGKALDNDEMKFDVAHEEGGIEPLKTPRADLEAIVSANTTLMATAGQVATPAVFFCQKDKGPVYVNGSPQDLSGMVAQLDSASKIEACNKP